MTIDKNQIGKSRSDRFQYTAGYRWRVLIARNMPHRGMAAVDHRCRTWMEADPIPKIFRPFSKVLHHQFIDIPTPGTEQSNNISCSVVPQMSDSPVPASQIGADGQCPSARRLSRESDELVKYFHLAR